MVHFGFHTKLIQVTLSALFCSMKLTLCFTDQENTFVGINPSVLNKNRYIIKQCPYTCCPLNATGLMELLLCSGSIGNIRLLQKTYHVIEAVEYICIFSIFSWYGASSIWLGGESLKFQNTLWCFPIYSSNGIIITVVWLTDWHLIGRCSEYVFY